MFTCWDILRITYVVDQVTNIINYPLLCLSPHYELAPFSWPEVDSEQCSPRQCWSPEMVGQVQSPVIASWGVPYFGVSNSHSAVAKNLAWAHCHRSKGNELQLHCAINFERLSINSWVSCDHWMYTQTCLHPRLLPSLWHQLRVARVALRQSIASHSIAPKSRQLTEWKVVVQNHWLVNQWHHSLITGMVLPWVMRVFSHMVIGCSQSPSFIIQKLLADSDPTDNASQRTGKVAESGKGVRHWLAQFGSL